VATQLFANAIRNAETSDLEALKEEARQIRDDLAQPQIDLISQELSQYVGGNLDFAPLLAALRMCAFIHDLGHLPYSHVFENALDSFIAPGLGKLVEIKASVVNLRHDLTILLEETSTESSGPSEPSKIHERLGLQLALALSRELSTESSAKAKLAAHLIHTASNLLSIDSAKFPITESFIKGTVDADRIDFTRRDGYFSGLFSSAVDYGRLFTLYTLQRTGVKESQRIISCPSHRAISETEKLLWERFPGLQVYRHAP